MLRYGTTARPRLSATVRQSDIWRPVRLALVVLLAAAGFSVAAPAWANAATVVPKSSITSNTTWSAAESPYVVTGSVTVNSGVTLTISPGVVVKVSGSTTEIYVKGALNIAGAAAAPVTFTSIQDDSIGGDDGGDGPTLGAPGQWYRIRFGTSALQSSIQNALVRYSGYGTGINGSAINVDSGNAQSGVDAVTIQDSVVSGSKGNGISVSGVGASANVVRTLIEDNGQGMYVGNNGTMSVDSSVIRNNTNHGIRFNLLATSSGAATVLTHNTITGNGGYGILNWIYADLPADRWPRLNFNNIYLNDGYFGNQLWNSGSSYYTPPDAVDWSQNFWGSDVFFRYNDPRCWVLGLPKYLGHLAYFETAFFDPGAGPIASSATPIVVPGEKEGTFETIECYYDRHFIGPDDFSPNPY